MNHHPTVKYPHLLVGRHAHSTSPHSNINQYSSTNQQQHLNITNSVHSTHTQSSNNNIYDTVHMTVPAAHRALCRLTVATLLLQARAGASISNQAMALLSSLLSRLLQVLAGNADKYNQSYQSIIDMSAKLALPYSNASAIGTGHATNDLLMYLRQVMQAELRGPRGVTSSDLGTIGLVPKEYKLIFDYGRIEEPFHSFPPLDVDTNTDLNDQEDDANVREAE